MTDNNATQDEVMRALGFVVWRYGELVFVLAQTVWLLMAETPSGRTFGPFATADLDFAKMVRAIQRLSTARDLSPDLKKRIERGARRAFRLNTERVDLLHAWFGMVVGDEERLEPRIIRVQPSKPTLTAHVSRPDSKKLMKLADDLATARDEFAQLAQAVAKELGIGAKE